MHNNPLVLLHVPASVELKNYPTALRNLQTPLIKQHPPAPGKPKRLLDMGAVDVWRSREARVPLFNDYRKVGDVVPCAACEASMACWLATAVAMCVPMCLVGSR